MINCQLVLKTLENQGLKPEALYKQEDINIALDQLGQIEFDREISDQLFSQCKFTYQNFKQMYRVADLAQTIVDGCHILEEKIKKADSQLSMYRNYKNTCDQQLSTTSVYTDTRYLFLTILQLNNIPSKIKYSNCHITLILGAASQLAKPSQSFDKLNPEFNQEFEFSIPPLVSILLVQFYIKSENTLPTLYGQSQIQIQQLDDQIIKEIVLPLKDPVGREIGTSVSLEAQVVVNKHSYLQSQLAKFGQKIFTLEHDLGEYRNDLQVMQKPFIVKSQNQNTQRQSKVLQPIFNQWQQQTPQLQEEQQQDQSQIIDPQINEFEPQKMTVSKQPNLVDETPEAPYYLQHGVIIFTIYGLITLLVCFAKPSFLDLLVGHGLMFTIFLDRFDPLHIKVVGGGLTASIFYDILWLKQYHLWWYSNDENNPEWGLEAINLLRFVLLFTYIQFIYKFVVCYYLYQFYKEAEDPTKRYIFIIWKIVYKVGQARENISWQ